MSDPLAPAGSRDEIRHAAPAVARATRWTALLGGAVLVGVALTVTASVLMRWTLGEGINGDFEIVQIGTAVAAFAFLPYCQSRRGNIVVDSFTAALPARARAVLDAMWDLVLVGLAGLIAWRLTVGAFEAFSTGTTSMVLGIPTGYAVAAAAALTALLAGTAAATAWRLLRGGR